MSGLAARERMLADVRIGLSLPHKELPPTYFYDARGCALFEEITRLPEYYLTRAEQVLLDRHAARIVQHNRPRALVELGPGSAAKTRTLIRAVTARDPAVWFVAVDASETALASAAASVRGEFPKAEVRSVLADIRIGLELPPDTPHPVLAAFLGSTIGNFTPPECVDLLRRIRRTLVNGDAFLLGVDLVKDVARLEAAYNDPRGVTAEFNLNVLHAINRELGANFDPAAFRHQAFYNALLRRIEMHLVSLRPQSVHVPGAGDFSFDEGETIRTEISCKYDRQAVEWMLSSAGMRLVDWITGDDEAFALALAEPSP